MTKRLDTKISRTAEWTCACRATSFSETRADYYSEDYISLRTAPSFLQGLLKFPFSRRCFVKLAAKGIYEYIIGRTKYIDHEFQNALKEGYLWERRGGAELRGSISLSANETGYYFLH